MKLSMFSKHLKRKMHTDETANRKWYVNKKNKFAIVWNWKDSGKWKIFPDITMSILRVHKYTVDLYDSLEDAIRMYDLMIDTQNKV